MGQDGISDQIYCIMKKLGTATRHWKIELKHTRSHKGMQINEFADNLCTAAIKSVTNRRRPSLHSRDTVKERLKRAVFMGELKTLCQLSTFDSISGSILEEQ